MQLRKGAYSFDANGVAVASRSRLLINEGGQPYAVRRQLDCDGYITADGQAAIAQACSALQTALLRKYEDIVLYRDDGTASDTSLLNSTSITGVLVTDLDFPDSHGAEYATLRHFRFTAEAEYPLTDTLNLLLNFTERLTFSGGGPLYIHKPALNGLPQKQLVYPSTVFKATQEGEAVGYRKYPTAPAPIWPAALMVNPDSSKTAPRRRGRAIGNAGFEDYRITWQYQFESATVLDGTPHTWLG